MKSTRTITDSTSTPERHYGLTLRDCIPPAVLDSAIEGLSYHILVGAAIHAGLTESFTRLRPRRDECLELLHGAFDGSPASAPGTKHHVINEGNRRGGQNSRSGFSRSRPPVPVSAPQTPPSSSEAVALEVGGVQIVIRPA